MEICPRVFAGEFADKDYFEGFRRLATDGIDKPRQAVSLLHLTW